MRTGSKILAQLLPGLQRIQDTLVNFAESGAWDSIADSLARIIGLFLDWFNNILSKAPELLAGVANALQWVTDNIFAIAKALAAVAALQGVALIVAGIASLPGGIPLIVKGVALLGAGGYAFYQVSEWEKEANNKSNNESQYAGGGRSGREGIEPYAYEPVELELSDATLAAIDEANTPAVASGSSGAYSDDRSPLEKAMAAIDEAFRTREDYLDSKISLEDTRGNSAAKKSALVELADSFGEKLSQYMKLDFLVGSYDERKILETARNRILTEIAQISNDIKDGIDSLVGSFNVPSSFNALSEYAYITNDNSLVTRIFSNPEINVYVQVENLDEAGAAKLEEQVSAFVRSAFGKDDIVWEGMRNVIRNG